MTMVETKRQWIKREKRKKKKKIESVEKKKATEESKKETSAKWKAIKLPNKSSRAKNNKKRRTHGKLIKSWQPRYFCMFRKRVAAGGKKKKQNWGDATLIRHVRARGTYIYRKRRVRRKVRHKKKRIIRNVHPTFDHLHLCIRWIYFT